MKLLVLGGSGFVGSRLVRYFAERSAWRIEAPGSQECDLSNVNCVEFLRTKIDAETCVVFCSSISRLKDDSAQAFFRNVQMAQNVAAALAGNEYKNLVFFSSIDIYGRPPKEPVIVENSPIAPAGYYGHAKFASEFFLQEKLGAEGRLSIIRLPGVYSLDETDPSVLGGIFKALKRNAPVFLSGGGGHMRTYVSVLEIARLLENIISLQWSGVLNFGSSESFSLRESVETMRNFIGSSSDIVDAPGNGSEFNIVISADKVACNFKELTLLPLPSYLTTVLE